MKKKKTLWERAVCAVTKWYPRHNHHLGILWLAGYRAGKRDAKKASGR